MTGGSSKFGRYIAATRGKFSVEILDKSTFGDSKGEWSVFESEATRGRFLDDGKLL